MNKIHIYKPTVEREREREREREERRERENAFQREITLFNVQIYIHVDASQVFLSLFSKIV